MISIKCVELGPTEDVLDEHRARFDEIEAWLVENVGVRWVHWSWTWPDNKDGRIILSEDYAVIFKLKFGV
jgi:hypothetical protein